MVFDAIREAFVEGFEELDTNRDLNAFLNAPPIKIGANITPHGYFFLVDRLLFWKLSMRRFLNLA